MPKKAPLFLDGQESQVPCASCGVATKLIVKTNAARGTQFLGCPNYPDCHYTASIPESWKMRRAGQPELFGAHDAKDSG